MKHWHLTFVVVLAAVLLAPLALPDRALAHEHRTVAGKYSFVVGFLTEPAFDGQMNGISLSVTVPGENNRPIEGLENTLKATVIVGGGARSLAVDLEPRFRQPGNYNGYFMPTRAGSYIFQFSGTVEGTPIDERFESGPGRFNDVETSQAVQFPDKLLDLAGATQQIEAARSEAAAARLLGIAGIVLGAAGLAVGGAALLALHRHPAAAPSGVSRSVNPRPQARG